ncbi:MAG: ATP-dependent DNA helicase RecG [Muribaculaceae bacterium]|nr:ATP-dependent DNA helicase RecG [Muribaculaceae bacterium]
MQNFLDTEIKFLKGVGEARSKLLSSEIGVATFRDLLYYFPFRHIDRSRFYSIAELEGSDLPAIQIKGRFISFRVEGEGVRKRLVGVFSDGKRMIETVWFSKVKEMSSLYKPGVEYVIFGKPVAFHNSYSIAHPEVEVFNPEKPPTGFRGVYSLTDAMRKKGLSTRVLQSLADNLLKHPRFNTIPETLPAEIVSRYKLMPLQEALRQMHFPEDIRSLQLATERLKFEELFYVEAHILRYSMERSSKLPGFYFRKIGENFNGFYFNVLPFKLTGAQKRVLKEIRADMKTGRQMNRLLQGDVGSGKTMVAFMTMLMAVDNGFQSALMAPTEILATQHYATIKEWAHPLGIKVALLTGSTRSRERKDIHEGLLSGEIKIIIGTHALIEDTVQFKSLGLAVIDEQHRFGVAQRARMWSKSKIAPHVLVMTATPIPRTLAMTVYGDLEVSVIDELPPGRKPVTTLLRYDSNRMEVDRLIVSQLREGRQVYIVYPLISENEKLDLKSLEEGYKRTCETFPSYKVCFVHGKMKPEEKDHQMDLFVNGEARIMVATTVIEVGVNVPNASVMVIENAERFGLSQLHQLRGRVGRGADQSYCILMSKAKAGADTKKRLAIMTETTDGFLISEADMKIRGPGDMEGTQQSGLAFNLRVANLARDGQILTRARETALAVLRGNPSLLAPGCAPTEAKPEDMPPIILAENDLGIIRCELATRFAKSVDWSLIS